MSIWKNIKTNFFSILTVITGFVAIVANRIGFVDSDQVGFVVLTLLTLLASTFLIDQSRKLEKIEVELIDGFDNTIAKLGGVSISTLSATKGLSHAASQVENAEKSIQLATLGSSSIKSSDFHSEWTMSLQKKISENQVHTRYIFTDRDYRIKRVQMLFACAHQDKFFAGKYSSESTIPLSGFLITDNAELTIFLPADFGQQEEWINIRNSETVAAFSRYFENLWANSEKMNRND